MTRYRRAAALAVGIGSILVGLVLVVVVRRPREAVAGTAVAVVVLVGLAVAVQKLRGPRDEDAAAPPAWSEEGSLTPTAPERTHPQPPVSGVELSRLVESAGRNARDDGTVAAGIAVVRPELREALTEALRRGGADPEAVDEALADGSWTDDRTAAAVLDEEVTPPDRPLRRRLEAWLYPERVVTRRTASAVQAVAEAADEALPAVVGQRAPRNIPVLPPTVEDLQRAADGSLRPAVAPGTVLRGPGPTRFEGDEDEEDEEDGAPVGASREGGNGTETSSVGSATEAEPAGTRDREHDDERPVVGP